MWVNDAEAMLLWYRRAEKLLGELNMKKREQGSKRGAKYDRELIEVLSSGLQRWRST